MPDRAGIFRAWAGRCTATLTGVLGDVDLAEDVVAEAFVIAAGAAADPSILWWPVPAVQQ